MNQLNQVAGLRLSTMAGGKQSTHETTDSSVLFSIDVKNYSKKRPLPEVGQDKLFQKRQHIETPKNAEQVATDIDPVLSHYDGLQQQNFVGEQQEITNERSYTFSYSVYKLEELLKNNIYRLNHIIKYSQASTGAQMLLTDSLSSLFSYKSIQMNKCLKFVNFQVEANELNQKFSKISKGLESVNTLNAFFEKQSQIFERLELLDAQTNDLYKKILELSKELQLLNRQMNKLYLTSTQILQELESPTQVSQQNVLVKWLKLRYDVFILGNLIKDRTIINSPRINILADYSSMLLNNLKLIYRHFTTLEQQEEQLVPSSESEFLG